MSSASVITIPANEKIDIKIVEWQPETSETRQEKQQNLALDRKRWQECY
ncbi:MAG: hypothetical protein QM535_00010 [Limnohabitans sp.]|nr:hypothetical protein [Limnohabitans sp.]